MQKTETVGQRLIERIRAIKHGFYIDKDAKFGIKVTDFALDHRYSPGSVFKWVGDVVVPDSETILRLSRDLDASPGWLHYGDLETHSPKAQRRQGRRTAGSLVLAFSCGLAAMLGLPSGGAAGEPRALGDVYLAEKVVPYRNWLQKAYSWLVARPLLPLPCPA